MKAITKMQGHQYLVEPNQTMTIDHMNKEVGQTAEFDQVLMLIDDSKISLGQPNLQGVKVKAEILEVSKSAKVSVFKFKAKKGYRKKYGHRQLRTKIKILDIIVGKK